MSEELKRLIIKDEGEQVSPIPLKAEYRSVHEVIAAEDTDRGYSVVHIRTAGEFTGKALYIPLNYKIIVGKDSKGEQIIVFERREGR